ncbi:MAG TPA: hypothetical protein VJT83_04475 [Chitinophagaceae bacterium]|nr:hypothetical protein [Chitinophagaceae bacterium]
MKKISIWASQHKWASRILIVTMYVLLNMVGWFLANLLPQFSDNFASILLWSFSLLTFYIFLIYPSFKRNYFRRKMCDLVLITCTLGFVIVICNNGNVIPRNNVYGASIEGRDTNSLKNHPLYVNFKSKLEGLDKSKLTKREKRRIMKTQIKAIMHEKGMSAADRALMIFLCVILGIALLFGVALLSCAIGCGGSEALAVVVGLLGIVGVIFFVAWLAKKIVPARKYN